MDSEPRREGEAALSGYYPFVLVNYLPTLCLNLRLVSWKECCDRLARPVRREAAMPGPRDLKSPVQGPRYSGATRR
ncbi:hypothetical protein ABTD73_20315, partial [Acinetobacter baumannii]